MRLVAFEDAVIREATERARAAEDAAARAARAIVERAEAEADAEVEAARREGRAEADREMAAEVLAGRRRARRLVLEAERAAYERLRAAAVAAACALRDDPGYEELAEGLAAAARRQLGQGTQLRPAPGGGVIGEVGGRRVDYSLSSLADRAVDAVAPALLEAWA